MDARKQWDNIFKMFKEKKNCQPGFSYPEKPLFNNEGKIQTFPNKQKMRKCVASRATLQKILK